MEAYLLLSRNIPQLCVHVLFFCSAVLVDDNSFVIDVFYLFLTRVSVLPTDIHHLLTRSMVWVGQMTQFDVMSVYSTHSHTLILYSVSY